MTRVFVAVALSCSLAAWADPSDPAKEELLAAAEVTTQDTTAKPEAGACAKSGSLMGTGCSYTTGMMAQRVLAEGKKYAFTGTLTAQPEGTRAGVAVPFAIGEQHDIHVIANEYVEELTTGGSGANKLELSGKVLDVNGTRFFLLEGYKDLSS
jgi:hypothetical protein